MDSQFEKYLAKYGKSYSTKEEYEMRKDQFKLSHEAIEKINSSNDNSFQADHNKFSDWTHEEYK